MMRKQNRDPNRSTRTSNKLLVEKKAHNSSMNTISSTQKYPTQSIKVKENKNSRILAQIKQSKQITSKQGRQNGGQSNMASTRSNYKPRFILKDLMQQKQQSSIPSSNEQDNESLYEEYFMQKHSSDNNISNTFNNSPLASESCYRFPYKEDKLHEKRIVENNLNRNRSTMLSKKSCLENEEETKRSEYENIKNCSMPVLMKVKGKVKKISQKSVQHTQQNQDSQQQTQQYYEEASTVQYSKRPFSKKPIQEEEDQYQFERRIRSISTTNPCRPVSTSIDNKNYKMSYLQTRKQLQIRSAYFNEAIELCKHIIGNMKQTLEEEYCERESDRVMWCHQRCDDMLQAFGEWGNQ